MLRGMIISLNTLALHTFIIWVLRTMRKESSRYFSILIVESYFSQINNMLCVRAVLPDNFLTYIFVKNNKHLCGLIKSEPTSESNCHHPYYVTCMWSKLRTKVREILGEKLS